MPTPTPLRSAALVAAGVLALAGCASGGDQSSSSPSQSSSASASSPAPSSEMPSSSSTPSSGMGGHDMSQHQHMADGGPAPAGMKAITSPKYPVGSTVILTADHMPGMKGAKAKVVGAYDTTTYAVTYTPTTGGPQVKDHKWVVQQELKDPGPAPLRPGTKVTLEADHMPGMKGATATIDEAVTEPVYIVDVEGPGMTMKNHKWVVQSEMRPAT